ncbi:MAG: hypothetical protein JSW50_12250 [Candidatus Latescibacterota bacterium]|nr:MAG: hypothetical protein JSW50_12250 [Candidatus Latescibacterota bacterium]
MPKLILKCDSCGEAILQPYDEDKVQRCPSCGRITSLNVVDLSDRPDILRRLDSIKSEPPALRRKKVDI